MADDEAFTLDFMEINPTTVSKRGVPRLHAIDWFTDFLQPEFCVRQLPDCLDSGHLLIRIRNAPHQNWASVRIKTFSRKATSGLMNLHRVYDGYNAASFLEPSRFRHSILFLIGLSYIPADLEREIVQTYGRSLGDYYPARFNTFPVEFVAMHSGANSFHPFFPTRILAGETFSDETPHLFGIPDLIATGSNLIMDFKLQIRAVILQRELSGNTRPYMDYFTCALTVPESKYLEG